MPIGLIVSEEEFVAAKTDADILRFLVNFAVLAPSGHNTQPWLFGIGDRHLDLLADRTRALPVVDPCDRALTISCGAALEHLVIAGRRFGRQLIAEELPDFDPDHLATVRLGDRVAPTASDIAMCRAIPDRRTTRTVYDRQPLPPDLLEACRELAAGRGTELRVIEAPGRREEIAELVARGDRIQFGDPGFRRELATWVHSRRAAAQEGMSGESFGIPDVLSPIAALVIRTFDIGSGIAAADRRKIAQGSPVLGVFSTPADEPGDWLSVGRALSRVLLKLTASGATAAFLNQPIEVESLRPLLKQAIGTSCMPQLLMRFGYGPALRATVRRPVEDVVVSGCG
jgi:hypothetical protein